MSDGPRYGGWQKPISREDFTTTVTPLDTKGPKRLWNAPAGFVVRERGDVDGLVTLEYMCPVHGRFEARVSRRDAPDEVACPNPLDERAIRKVRGRVSWLHRADPAGTPRVQAIAFADRTEVIGWRVVWSPASIN